MAQSDVTMLPQVRLCHRMLLQYLRGVLGGFTFQYAKAFATQTILDLDLQSTLGMMQVIPILWLSPCLSAIGTFFGMRHGVSYSPSSSLLVG